METKLKGLGARHGRVQLESGQPPAPSMLLLVGVRYRLSRGGEVRYNQRLKEASVAEETGLYVTYQKVGVVGGTVG